MKIIHILLLLLLLSLPTHAVNSDSLALTNKLSIEGMQLYHKGKYKAAEMKFRQALAIDTLLFMDNHHQRIIYTGMWLGNTLCKLGRTEEALDGIYTAPYCFADPVDFRKMEKVDSLGTLGNELMEQQKWKEAYEVWNKRQPLLDNLLPKIHVWNANNKYQIASVLRHLSYNETPQPKDYVNCLNDYFKAWMNYYEGKEQDAIYISSLLEDVASTCEFRFLWDGVNPNDNIFITAIHKAEELFKKLNSSSVRDEFYFKKDLNQAYFNYVTKACTPYNAEQADKAYDIFTTIINNYQRMLAINDSQTNHQDWKTQARILEKISSCYDEFAACNVRQHDIYHNSKSLYKLSEAQTRQDSTAMARINMLDAVETIVKIMNNQDKDSVQWLHERFCRIQSINALSQAVAIYQKNNNHDYFRTSLTLANYYNQAKMPEQAISILQKMLPIYEHKDMFRYCEILYALGGTYRNASRGTYNALELALNLAWGKKINYKQMVTYYNKSIDTFEQLAGIARTEKKEQYRLANLCCEIGELYYEKAIGTNDSLLAIKAIRNLEYYFAKRDYKHFYDDDEKKNMILKCKELIKSPNIMLTIDRRQQELFKQDLHTFLYATKKEKARVIEGNYWDNIVYAHNNSEIPHAGNVAYNSLLFNKEILLSSDKNLLSTIDKSPNAEIKKLSLQLTKIRKSTTEDNDKTRSLERRILELCRQEKDFNANLFITWQDVKKELSNKDLAMEFYKTWDGDYGVVVLSNKEDEPHLVKLFTQAELDKYKDNYFTPEASSLIWLKLLPYMRGKKNIYFATDGELHNIPIEYMPATDGKGALSDSWNFFRLSSTRELVNHSQVKSHNAVIYGGLKYSLNTSSMQQDALRYPQKDSTRSVDMATGFAMVDRAHSGVTDLKYTKIEASKIKELFDSKRINSQVYCDSMGTETSFKNLNADSTNIIHIATHGFYLTKEQFNRFAAATHLSEEVSDNAEDLALIRSGLYFSGVNNVLRGRTIPQGVDDGILTAKEISMMNFRNLDLVVLSACQTALGDIGSDGVFGLQRGFKMAGARTLLMSLWKVDDRATQMLMEHFYSALLSGKSKTVALQEAQRKVREYEVVTDAGKMHPYLNPKFWAAFILLDAI